MKRFIHKYKIPIKRALAIVLNIAMLLTMSSISDLGVVFAAGPDGAREVTINGQPYHSDGFSFVYGQTLEAKVNGEDATYTAYSVFGVDGGSQTVGYPSEPGVYDLQVIDYYGDSSHHKLTITKDQLPAPTDLTWADAYSYKVSWNMPEKTVNDISYDKSAAISKYVLQLWKEIDGNFTQVGEDVEVTDPAATEYDSFSTLISENGYGDYIFKIKAVSGEADHYTDSEVAESRLYLPEDTVDPTITDDSFTFAYNGDVPVLTARAKDDESGIYGYAFLKGVESLERNASGWTKPALDDSTAGVVHTFNKNVAEADAGAGSYKFFVKDKDNVSSVSNAITIAKVTYMDYCKGGALQNDYIRYVQTGSTTTALEEPVRKGYDFKGWYKTRTGSEGSYSYSDKIESLTANSTEALTVYAQWEKSTIDVTIEAGTDSDGILSPAGMPYSGKGEIKATIESSKSEDWAYQWYKYNPSSEATSEEDRYEEISGAVGSTLEVKNVSDSGTYKVKITWDADSEDGSKFSAPVEVKIKQKDLHLTPSLKADKHVYYADDVPAKEDYTFAIEVGDLAEGDAEADIVAEIAATDGSYVTNYTKGKGVGSYSITAKDFTAENYNITFNPGSFTVEPKVISDANHNQVSIELTQETGKTGDRYSYKGGTVVEPEVTLTDSAIKDADENAKMLVSSTDYTVAYSNNVDVTDDATITITFSGNYTGSLTKKFIIEKAEYTANVGLKELFTDGKYMYDGVAHSTAFYVSDNPGAANVTYYFQTGTTDKNGETTFGTATTTVPKHAGKYQVYAVIAETASYASVTTEPTRFEITKRHITIESEGGEWEYDGNAHSITDIKDEKITIEDGDVVFAPGEDFLYKIATSTITDVGEIANEIDYAFAHGTDANDYEVTLKKGKLIVTKQQLKTPANQTWEKVITSDTARLAVAKWIAVTKQDVNISYKLQLYRKDGDTTTAVGDPVTVDTTSHSFYDAIMTDLKSGKGVPDGYFFTVQTIPASGTKAGNYVESDPTPIEVEGVFNSALDMLYATKAAITPDSATVKYAKFKVGGVDTADEYYAVQGQIFEAVAEANPGYSLKMIEMTPAGTLSSSSDTDNGVYRLHVYTTGTIDKAVNVTVHASDDHPKLKEFIAKPENNPVDGKKEVIISFEATDVLGIKALRVGKGGWTENNIGDDTSDQLTLSPGTHQVTINDVKYNYTYSKDELAGLYRVTGTAIVTDAGDYNFVVWDTSEAGNWTYWAKTVKKTEMEPVYNPVTGVTEDKPVLKEVKVLNPISVYKITFKPGTVKVSDVDTPASMITDGDNAYPAYLLKLTNESITIPDVTGRIYANGFTFTNFRGTTGLYPNQGTYTANKNDDLTAYWSDDNYKYTVHYWYQGIDEETKKAKVDEYGKPDYTGAEDTSATATFIAQYGWTISSGNPNIQKKKTGFERDNDKDESFTVDGDGHEINVYYKRSEYTITYKYVDTKGVEKTYSTETHKYGEGVSAKEDKPSADGYDFIGWTYGDSGKAPETMPEKSIFATGKFEPKVTKYIIDYYYENVDNENYTRVKEEEKYTYTYGEKDANDELIYYSAKHNTTIDLSHLNKPEIEGFTLHKTAVYHGASSATCPAGDSATEGVVSALSEQTLHIAYYYKRNTYGITLNVYWGGRSNRIYTTTVSGIKFETPFNSDKHAYYENLDKERWTEGKSEDEKKVYELLDIADWSTGEKPTRMPAVDNASQCITINRDYVSTTLCPYDVEIYYEKEAGSDTPYQRLTQYTNENSIVEIQKSGTASAGHTLITEDRLQSIYPDLGYYELDTTKLSEGRGTVTKPNKDEEGRLVIKAFFKKPIVSTTITYKYFDPDLNETVIIGTLKKTGKWYTDYDTEAGLFFGEGGAKGVAGKKSKEDPEAMWEFTPAKIKVNDADGKYVSSGVNLSDSPGTKVYPVTVDSTGAILLDGKGTPIEEFVFTSDNILNISYNARYLNEDAKNYTWPTGEVKPDAADKTVYIKFGAERDAIADKGISEIKNYSNVTYVRNTSGSGIGHYYINIGYQTSGLKRYKPDIEAENKTNVPLTVTIDDVKYKVRVANKIDIFDYEGSGESIVYSDTPKAGFVAYNCNDRYGYSQTVYLAKANADGQGPVIGANSPEDFKDNYLYIVDEANRLVWGKMLNQSYSKFYWNVFDKDADAVLEEYKTKEAELMTSFDFDPAQYDASYFNAVKWSDTGTYQAVITGPFWQNIYFDYQPDIYLTYSLYGNPYQINVARDTEIKLDNYKSTVDAYYRDEEQQGKVIYWYKDSAYTQPAEDFTITETTILYGRHEKETYKGHHYVKYQLADPVKIGEESYDYLDEAQLVELVKDTKSGFTVDAPVFSIIKYDTEFLQSNNTPVQKDYTSTTLIYRYHGTPVLISRTIPELSCSEVLQLNYQDEMYTTGFEGFVYDSTAANKVRAYCEYGAVDLQAFYKRVTYPLTYDFMDKDATGHKKTDDLVLDAPYKAEFLLHEPVATRDGYKLKDDTKWKYYKKAEDGTLTELPSTQTTMPDYEVVAQAQWEPDYFDYDVLHYFQKNDQTYETDVVKELAATAEVGETHPFIFNEETDKDRKARVYEIGGKKYAVHSTIGEVLYFSGELDSEGKFIATISDLIGMKTTAQKSKNELLTKQEYNCDNFAYPQTDTLSSLVSDMSAFKYAFTVYRLGADIKTLHVLDDGAEKYVADVDMELGLYYEREDNITVTIATRVTDDPYSTENPKADPLPTGITAIGAGKYHYGSEAELSVQIANGYEFVGWYKVEEYNGHVKDQNFESKAKKYATATSITVPTTVHTTLVAVTRPKEVKRPKNEIVNGMENLAYGYHEDASHFITMTVDLEHDEEGYSIADSSVYHVKSYQWYKSDSTGKKGEKIEGATAATYNIENNLDSGTYHYYCEVEVERFDNGRSITIAANTSMHESPVVVANAEMLITEKGETVIYDGEKHYGNITINRESAPENIRVFFSTEPLDNTNYEEKGKEYKDILSTTELFYPYKAENGGVFFEDVLTEGDGESRHVAMNGDKYAPQYIYYYVLDDSAAYGKKVNYNDASGKLPIIITPREVTIKPKEASFKKTYDGGTALTEADKDEFRTPDKYFEIVGLLEKHRNELTARFEGKYDDAHVKHAKKIDVEISNIETVTTREINFNYEVADISHKVSFAGEIVARPVDIKWVYSLDDQGKAKVLNDDGKEYFEYKYNGKEQAPAPVITKICADAEEDKIGHGVLSEDRTPGIVTVEASGKQKNCAKYTAVGQLVVSDSPLGSESSDYKIEEEQLRCLYRIYASNLPMKLVGETVTYDGKEHKLTKLTPETLVALGVIDNASQPTTVTESSGVYTVQRTTDPGVKVSYSVNKKYKNAGTYSDFSVLEGTVVVVGSDGKFTTGNFGFSYPTSTLKIEKKKVTVQDITADNKEYDTTDKATLKFDTIKFPQLESGDELSLDTTKVTGKFADANVGNGKVVTITFEKDASGKPTALTGASKDNYELVVGEDVNGYTTQSGTTANITPATLTVSPISFNNIDYTYGEAMPTEFTNTTAQTSTYIKVEGYKGTEERKDSVADIGGTITFLLLKDSVTSAVSGISTKDAGDYEVTLQTETVDGIENVVVGMTSVNNNYIFVLGDNCDFTIKKRSVSPVQVNTKTKVYDGTTSTANATTGITFADGDFSLSTKSGTTDKTGVVNLDDVKITVSESGFSAEYTDANVGNDKTIAVTGLELAGEKAGNYELSSTSLNLTGCVITKAPLKVIAGNLTDVPYGTNPLQKKVDGSYMDSVTYTGLVNGESASVLGGTLGFESKERTDAVSGKTYLEFDATNASKRNVNNTDEYYDITPKGLTSDNYAIEFVSGKFNVSRKLITVTARSFNLAYNSFNSDELKAEYGPKSDGPTVDGWAYSDGAISTSALGTLKDGGKAATYDEDVKEYAAAYSYTEVEGDTTKPAGTYDVVIGRPDSEAEGAYKAAAIELALETRYTNYDFTLKKGTFEIGKRVLKIDGSKIKIDSRIYDATTGVRSVQIKENTSVADYNWYHWFSTEVNHVSGALPDIENIKTEYYNVPLDAIASDDIVSRLEKLGLKITGEYSDKNVGTGKTVTLTVEILPGTYFGNRYCFSDNAKTMTIATTADITKKALHIKPRDIEVVYGSKLPDETISEIEVIENPDYKTSNPEKLKEYQNKDYDWGFAGEEGFYDILNSGADLLTCGYKSKDTATKAGETGVKRSIQSGAFVSNNYEITRVAGNVKVIQAQLATPQNVLWSSTNPGTLTWDKVDKIGDVEVGGYKVILSKTPSGGVQQVINVIGSDVTEIDGKTTYILNVPNDGSTKFSHNFYADIMAQTEDKIAIYTVEIWAYPANIDGKNKAIDGAVDEKGKPVKTNVRDSAHVDTRKVFVAGQQLAVATITPEFATDAATEAGKGTLKIKKSGDDDDKYGDSVVLIAGEKAVIRVVPKETRELEGNPVTAWTGYTISDSNITKNKWDPAKTDDDETDDDWTVSGGTQLTDTTNKGAFTTEFTLHVTSNKTALKPVVALEKRAATLDADIATVNGTGYVEGDPELSVRYTFTQGTGPKATVTPKVESTDNINTGDYTYSYNWKLIQYNSIELAPATASAFTDNQVATLPEKYNDASKGEINLPSGTNRYKLQCEITATRKDNGEVKKITVNSALLSVGKAKANFGTTMGNWTYGETRQEPALSTTYDHPDGEGYGPFYYYSKDVNKSNDESEWVETPYIDAGSYKVRAHYNASANVEAYDAPSDNYTVSKATFANPTVNAWTASTDAPYGKASWTEVAPIKENAGGSPSDATVNPVYEVKLHKKVGDTDTVIYTTYVSGLECDLTAEIDKGGVGTYYYTITAKPASKDSATTVAQTTEKNRNNVNDSATIKSNEITVARLTSSTGSFTKIYDGTYTGAYDKTSATSAGITVLATENEDSYEWYKNGTKITTGDVFNTYDVPVFNHESNPDKYSCVSKKGDKTTYYITEAVDILQRAVTFKANSASRVYDGTALTNNGYTVEGSGDAGLVSGDEVASFAITVMNNASSLVETRTDVGTSRNVPSSFVIKRDSDDVTSNYNITYVAGTLTVIARPINDSSLANGYAEYITVADVDDYVYDATAKTPEPAVRDTVLDKTLVKDTVFEYSYSNNTNAGTATITITAKGNYSGTITKTFAITRRPIEFVGDSDSKTYNATEQSITTFTTKKPDSAGVGGIVSGHTASATYKAARTVVGSSTGAFTEGSFKITDAIGNDVTANYQITSTTGTMEITATSETMTVSLANEEFVYDATAKHLLGNPTVTGIGGVAPEGTTTYQYKFSDAITWVTELSSLTQVGAGTYTINVKAHNDNYASDATTDATLTITPRPVLIRGISEGKAYTGSPITINGIEAVKPTEATVGGLVSGHSHNGTFSATGTDKGEYDGTITEASDIEITDADSNDVTENYAITVENGKLTINASTLDWFVYLAGNVFTYTAGSLHLTGTPSVSAKASDGNAMTITGTTTYTYRFKDIGDFVSDLTSLVKKDVGEYLIEVKAVNDNFVNPAKKSATENIFYALLKINKADATTSVNYKSSGPISTGSREYNGSAVSVDDFDITYSADSIVAATGKGTQVVKWYKVEGGATTELASAPVNVGTYKIKVNYTAGSNFKATDIAEKEFTITPKTSGDDYYKVTTTNYEGLHDGQPHTGAVTYMPSNGTIKYGLTAEQADGTDAGNAPLTALPTFTDIGDYTVYYHVTEPNYANPITGFLTVKIKPNTYTITYDANFAEHDHGNTATGTPASQTKTQQVSLTLDSAIPTSHDENGEERFVFVGWNTKADGTGTTYAPGATFDIDANTVLYSVWEEKIEGKVTFDYNYVDPEDLGNHHTEQTLSETYVVLYRTVDGITTEVAKNKITLKAKDADSNKSEDNPYAFEDQPTYVGGHKAHYTVGLAAVPGNDISNYDINEHGYRNRDIVAMYSPGSFKLTWVVTLDDTGFTAEEIAKIPTSIDVKVLYRESADGSTDSFRIITQHTDDSVHCLYDAATKTYRGEYLVWKWNSATHDTYYHSLEIVGMTLDDEYVEEPWLLKYVYTQDTSVRPVCFEPDDRNYPLREGRAVGGVNNDGVMTAKLYKYIPAPEPDPEPDDDDDEPIIPLPVLPVKPTPGNTPAGNKPEADKPEQSVVKPDETPDAGRNKIIEIIPSEKNIDHEIMTGFVEMEEEEVLPLLTEEERKRHEEDYDKVTLRLEVKNVPKEIKEKSEKSVLEILAANENLAEIFDVSMFIKVGELNERKLDPSSDVHKVSIQIPDKYVDHTLNEARQFAIVRVYVDKDGNYKSERIDCEEVGNNYIAFEADTESTYALVYTGEPRKNFILFNFLAMLAMFVLTLVMLFGRSKKEDDDETKERREVDEDFDELVTEEEKKRRKHIRFRKIFDVVIFVVSLIIYIIFFTRGKIVWFDRLSWYYAIALILTFISTINKRFNKAIEADELDKQAK